MRNLSPFKIIGAIGSERRAKGGALFHIIGVYFRSGLGLKMGKSSNKYRDMALDLHVH